MSIPTKEQWQTGEINLPLNLKVWYTDGLRLTGRGRSGVHLEGREVEMSIPLISYATVFHADDEVATSWEAKQGRERTINIRVKTLLVQECAEAIDIVAEEKEVRLVWVPGHS